MKKYMFYCSTNRARRVSDNFTVIYYCFCIPLYYYSAFSIPIFPASSMSLKQFATGTLYDELN